jgi:hypothetical protein
VKRYEVGWNGPASSFALFEQPDGSVMKSDEVRAVIQAAQDKLTRIMVGGCTCNTKTPELRFHSERCHFRLASEASEALSPAVPSAVPSTPAANLVPAPEGCCFRRPLETFSPDCWEAGHCQRIAGDVFAAATDKGQADR